MRLVGLSAAAWGAVGLIGAAAVAGAVTLVVEWWRRSTKVDTKIDIAVQAVIDQLKAATATATRAERRAEAARQDAAEAKQDALIARLRAEGCEERERQHLSQYHGHGGGDG